MVPAVAMDIETLIKLRDIIEEMTKKYFRGNSYNPLKTLKMANVRIKGVSFYSQSFIAFHCMFGSQNCVQKESKWEISVDMYYAFHVVYIML